MSKITKKTKYSKGKNSKIKYSKGKTAKTKF